jgi:phage I-like protein
MATEINMQPIDLATITLAEGANWIKAIGFGRHQHPIYGELTFDRERLQRYADNVNRRVRGIDLSVDYEHRTDPTKGKKAAGWIQQAEVRNDGLYLSVSWTQEARNEIRAGHYRYWSPELLDTWQNPQTGETHHDVLVAGALVNRPFLKDLPAIAASEDGATRRRINLQEQAEQLTPGAEFDLSELGFLGLVEARVNQGGMAFSDAADAVAREYPEIYDAYRSTLI